MNNDLISRSALLDSYDVRNVTEYDETGCGMNYKAVPVEAIEKAPAVDAVEVVRCKDCLHYRPWLYGDKICALIGSYYGKKQPDDYCSRGRKRE